MSLVRKYASLVIWKAKLISSLFRTPHSIQGARDTGMQWAICLLCAWWWIVIMLVFSPWMKFSSSAVICRMKVSSSVLIFGRSCRKSAREDFSNYFFRSRNDQKGEVKAPRSHRECAGRRSWELFVDFLVQKQSWIPIWHPGQIFHSYKVQQKGHSGNLIRTSGHFLLENWVGRKVSSL